MLSEQLLHAKKKKKQEEIKIPLMMRKVRLLTLESEKQNWLGEVGRDLGVMYFLFLDVWVMQV